MKDYDVSGSYLTRNCGNKEISCGKNKFSHKNGQKTQKRIPNGKFRTEENSEFFLRPEFRQAGARVSVSALTAERHRSKLEVL